MNKKGKIVLKFFSMIFSIMFLCTADNKNRTAELIGKTFTDITNIRPDLKQGAGSVLPDNDKYCLTVYLIENAAAKGQVDSEYVFFTKIIDNRNGKTVFKILDVISVNLSKFKKFSKIGIDDCRNANEGSTHPITNVSIYVPDDNGASVHPQAAWQADIKSGKLIPISPERLLCSPETSEEEGEGEGEE